jgi:hypothetical protein
VELLAISSARIPCDTSSREDMDPREPSRSVLKSIAVSEKACDGAGVPVDKVRRPRRAIQVGRKYFILKTSASEMRFDAVF